MFTGGPGEKQKYPLSDPKVGDIVFVRFGVTKGRGIGVVYRNDYQNGYDGNHRLHVLWLNKASAQLSGKTPVIGFSHAYPTTIDVFRQTKQYEPTFELLERLDRREKEKKTAQTKEAIHSPQEVNSKMDAAKMDSAKNLILYGPPGTGKTWQTVDKALKILDPEFYDDHNSDRTALKRRFDQLRAEGWVGFVTFHQSFSYEDFVEGAAGIHEKRSNSLQDRGRHIQEDVQRCTQPAE